MSKQPANNSSLLERAKAVQKKGYISDYDRMELAIAYIAGEISATQIAAVLWPGKRVNQVSTMIYTVVALGVRTAFREGRIKVKASQGN